MNDDRTVLAIHDANLKHRRIPGWADEHGEPLIEVLGRDGIANRTQHVLVGDAMPTGTIRDAGHTQASYLAKARVRKLTCD